MTEHYFSDRPQAAARTRSHSLSLAGRDLQVTLSGGVFSARGLDLGTHVFLSAVPAPPHGAVALDLGCGWGPLTLALASALDDDGQVWAIDVNERARALTRKNLAANQLSATVTSPEEALASPIRFDLIWSNPPIRIGKEAARTLLATWLERLAPGGEAYFVIAKNLGADSYQQWLGAQGYDAVRIASRKGYRVLRVRQT